MELLTPDEETVLIPLEGVAGDEPRAVGSELEGRHAVVRRVKAMRVNPARVAIVAGALAAGGGLLVVSFLLGLHTRPLGTKTPECPRSVAAQGEPVAAQPGALPQVNAQPPAGALDSTLGDADGEDPSGDNSGVNVAAPGNPTPGSPPANGPLPDGSPPLSPPAPSAPPPTVEVPASPPPNAPALNPAAPANPAAAAPYGSESPPRDSSGSNESFNAPPSADPAWRGGPPPHRFNPGRRRYWPDREHDQPEGPLHRAVSGLGGL